MAKTRLDEIEEQAHIVEESYDLIKERVEWEQFADEGLVECLDDHQKDALSDMVEALKKWQKIDKQLEVNYRNIESFKDEIQDLEEDLDQEDKGSAKIDHVILNNEFICIKQMFKMCVGRRSNHFPILEKDYFLGDPKQVASKENVFNILKEIEYLDPGLFYRTHRGVENRIYPIVILLPSYGEFGVCWEPF